MSSWAGTSRISSDLIKRYIQPKCISDYSRYRNEFVRQIEALSKSNQREFCKRCDIIKKNIKEKDRELNHCYVKNLVTVKLIQNDNIKDFIEECPEIPECNKKYIPSANIKESSSLKKTVTERSCISGKGCNKETATKREEKPKLQPGVPAGNPKRISSSRLQHKDQRPQVPTGNEPINTRVISQSQPSTTHTVPLVAQVEVPEHEKKHLALSESSKVNAEETHPKDLIVPAAINNESATGHSSEVMDSGKNTIQVKLPGDEAFDGNPPGQQHISDKVLLRNDSNDQAVASNIRDTTLTTEGVSLGENPSDRNHVEVSAKAGDLVSATASEHHGEETATETVSGDESTINSAGSELKNFSDENSSNADTNTENFPDKNLCSEEYSDKFLSTDTPCNVEKGSELVSDNDNELDIFGKILVAISNKDHIIQASIPIGIVLLLGLLFKYTSLWRILTKKKRKEPVDMNEELHSVLQEPSIMDEERSIPFSYGAFEHSTFDENTY
ncbi:PIR protein [Plasmodium vivax]|uniref:VIR protein n=1 Tax=Plasmodium vivax TaxID=5855 RepID=A0A564ZUG0_PLAVI|nr:PIR protein [Plasmodium vivax]